MTRPSSRYFAGEPTDPENRALLNVVIIYDDLSAGKRAMGALEMPTREFEEEIQFRCQPWRFDFLEDSGWREFAEADVNAADLVFISISKRDALPKWFRAWLSGCLAKKQGGPGGVVVLPGSRESTGGGGVVDQLLWLEGVAREAGWDFFDPTRQDNDLAAGSDRFGGSLRDGISAEVTSRVFFEPVNYTGYRHWGINE